SGDSIRLVVSDRGAKYPVIVDPVTEATPIAQSLNGATLTYGVAYSFTSDVTFDTDAADTLTVSGSCTFNSSSPNYDSATQIHGTTDDSGVASFGGVIFNSDAGVSDCALTVSDGTNTDVSDGSFQVNSANQTITLTSTSGTFGTDLPLTSAGSSGSGT